MGLATLERACRKAGASVHGASPQPETTDTAHLIVRGPPENQTTQLPHLVDVLAAGAAAAHGGDLQVRLGDLHLLHLVACGLWHACLLNRDVQGTYAQLVLEPCGRPDSTSRSCSSTIPCSLDPKCRDGGQGLVMARVRSDPTALQPCR